MSSTLVLDRLAGRFAICRLDAASPVPAWAQQDGALQCVTRTAGELSIITAEAHVPGDVTAQRGYVAYAVRGPLAFEQVGVLATLTRELADADVPVLAMSTYDTDVLLVHESQAAKAEAALGNVARVETCASQRDSE